jgi:hypothetical protein
LNRIQQAADERDWITRPELPRPDDGGKHPPGVVAGIPEPLADHRLGLPLRRFHRHEVLDTERPASFDRVDGLGAIFGRSASFGNVGG